MQFNNVQEIASWRLCVGCGACAAVCPENRIQLVDIVSDGIRPVMASEDCGDCHACVSVCPGMVQERAINLEGTGGISRLTDGWGTVLEVWEGYAADPEIRFAGSSGGAATALALSCIEKAGMTGVVHAGVESQPLISKTRFSKTRKELLAAAGSRYAPASPCDGIKRVEKDAGMWVFIGKPCDAAGVRKTQQSGNNRLKTLAWSYPSFAQVHPQPKAH